MTPTIAIACLLGLMIPTVSARGYRPDRIGSSQEDPGVDLAVVIATRANLRERPGTTSAVIKELKQGEVLALISRTPVGPWYNVIHVRSSTEGWINGNTIRVKYTEKRKAGPVFQERETGTSQDPSIKVTNDSNVTLYLKVGDDDRTVISPHATKVMVKSPGTYKFYASSPGVIPLLGEHEFRMGIIYEWTFYVVTTFR